MNILDSTLEKLEKDIRDTQMKLSFKEYILNEAKQVGNIYHFTTLVHIESILKDKKLKKGYQDYLSLTRDFQLPESSSYFERDEHIVRITLDGDKISENIKIFPFQDTFYKHKEEKEEGILNDIPIKYFKQIDILTNTSRYFSKTSINAVYDKIKKQFTNTNLVKKWRPVK